MTEIERLHAENAALRNEIEHLRTDLEKQWEDLKTSDEYRDAAEADNAKLRTLLQEIVRLRLATNEGTCARRFDRAWEVARRALEEDRK